MQKEGIFKVNEQQFDKNTWQTPLYIFNAMNRKHRFEVDGCASPENALCDIYFTEKDDFTKQETLDRVQKGSRVWINPPYNNPLPFVESAIYLMAIRDCTVVMLLPADKSTEWFSVAISAATQVIDIIGYNDEKGKFHSGRIKFINPVTGVEVSGNNKGSMFVIFDPNEQSQTQSAIRLNHLMARGGYGK